MVRAHKKFGFLVIGCLSFYSSQAEVHGHISPRTNTINKQEALPCPVGLFEQIYKRDQGFTLFDSANPSKACANTFSDRMIGSSEELEATIAQSEFLATQSAPNFLNQCLQKFDSQLNVRQKNAAIGEYGYLSTRGALGFRSNLETIVSLDRMLGSDSLRGPDYDSKELKFLPGAETWLSETDRDRECHSPKADSFNSQVQDSMDALAALQALDKAASNNRESDVSYQNDGSSSTTYSIKDAAAEAQINATKEWILTQYPWLRQSNFQKLVDGVGAISNSALQEKVSNHLRNYFKDLRRRLTGENNKILKAQACLHRNEPGCFRRNQKTFLGLPPIDFSQINEAQDKAEGLKNKTAYRRVSSELGFAQCRLGARADKSKVNGIAAELALNVGLTVATAGASVIATAAAKGMLALGTRGVMLATRVGTAGQMARGITLGADLVWLGKAGQEALEACQTQVLANHPMGEDPSSENLEKIRCNHPNAVRNSQVHRDMNACVMSAGMMVTNALPLVPAVIFQARRSSLKPNSFSTPAVDAIHYKPSEMIPEFKGQTGFTMDAYNAANLVRGKPEVLLEVKRLEALANAKSKAAVEKLKAGLQNPDDMDQVLMDVMAAQYYREMREAIENSGSAVGVALLHETPLKDVPTDIAIMVQKGLSDVSDIEKLRLLTWANHLSEAEFMVAAKALGKSRLARHAMMPDKEVELISVGVANAVYLANKSVAPGKMYFQFTAAEIKQKMEIIMKPMLDGGVKPQLAREVADDLVRSGLAGSLGMH